MPRTCERNEPPFAGTATALDPQADRLAEPSARNRPASVKEGAAAHLRRRAEYFRALAAATEHDAESAAIYREFADVLAELADLEESDGKPKTPR
jgi:hypothetical protein